MSVNVMKQAIEALEYTLNTSHKGFDVDMAELLAHRAIDSLYKAIADLEKQKPVATKKDAVFSASIEFIGTLTGMKPPPIETAPQEIFQPFKDFTEKVCAIFDDINSQPEREPLTDEQIREIAKQYALSLAFPYDGPTTPEMFARAIEAYHGIKENT